MLKQARVVFASLIISEKENGKYASSRVVSTHCNVCVVVWSIQLKLCGAANLGTLYLAQTLKNKVKYLVSFIMQLILAPRATGARAAETTTKTLIEKTRLKRPTKCHHRMSEESAATAYEVRCTAIANNTKMGE